MRPELCRYTLAFSSFHIIPYLKHIVVNLIILNGYSFRRMTNTRFITVRICPIIVAFYSADGILDQLLMLGISPDEG